MASPDSTHGRTTLPGSKVKSPAKTSKKVKDAVNFFTDPLSDTRVRSNVKLSLSLDAIVDEAARAGLSGPHIVQLADVAASGKFSDSVSSRLIKALLPADSIPQDAAVQSVSWMCTNKPSNEIQALLLKWLVLTFDLLDGTDQLHALYGVIFYFLENDTMCPHVCHLLYLLTRREDVIPYRVRKVLSIQKRLGAQPYLTGLLSLYKVYCPHLVVLSLPPTQRAYFKLTDRPWMARVEKAKGRVQELSGAGPGGTATLQREVTHRTTTDTTMVRKRRKLNPVPDLRSATLRLDQRADNLTKVPLEQVRSFQDFLHNFDRLELPSQAAAVLRSPVLQHLVVCRTDPHTTQRLSFWLALKLQTELMDSGGDSPRTEQLLQLLINFTDFIQESVPVCEQFLTRYLLTWNGHDYRPYILRLISRFRVYPFPVLNDLVLEPLRTLFCASSVYFKCQVLHTLTELLRSYVSCEISRYQEAARRQKEQENEDVLKEEGEGKTCSLSVFSVRVAYFDPLDTVNRLVQLVDGMCSVALGMHRRHALLYHHILTFYELVSSLYSKYSIPVAHMPSKDILYSALFGSDPTAASRMCQIICNYKAEFTALKSNSNQHPWEEVKKHVVVLNQVILTACNCLWRNKAFDPSADHGVSMEKVEAVGVAYPNKALSMQGSLAMVCFCKKFFEETQPAEKHINPQMIKSSHKAVYLDFLERERMDGVVNFMKTFIRRTGTSETTINRTEDTTMPTV